MLNSVKNSSTILKKLINIQSYYKTSVTQQPKLRLRTVNQIYPPPGINLEIPEWQSEKFLLSIGGGVSEYADKFDNINEIFTFSSRQLKEKGIPAHHRKHILNYVEKLRKGVLTFEYLGRRTSVKI